MPPLPSRSPTAHPRTLSRMAEHPDRDCDPVAPHGLNTEDEMDVGGDDDDGDIDAS